MVQDHLPVGIQFGHVNPMNLGQVVGVLVEVPVMLSLVAMANRNRRLFPD